MRINKKKVLNMNLLRIYLTGLIITMCCSWGLGQEKPVLIKDPKPTHKAKNLSPLELVHIIPSDFSDEHFFARPLEFVVDHKGNSYIYDDLLNKVLKFTDDFKFVKTIGITGAGPGELSPPRNPKNIGIWQNNLFLWDYNRQKMILYDLNGRHVKDIKFRSHFLNVFPGFAGKENHFIVTSKKNIEVWDNNFKPIYTLLTQKDYNTFLVHMPIGEDKKVTSNEPGSSNTWIRLLSGNRCMIYQSNSSTVYLYRDWHLKNRFHVRPELALQSFKDYIPRLRKKLGDDNFFTSIFPGFFIDRDNEKYIYFTGRGFLGKDKKLILYRFSMDGKLVNTLYYYNENKLFFYAKINDLFYAIDHLNDQIFIFKEKNK